MSKLTHIQLFLDKLKLNKTEEVSLNEETFIKEYTTQQENKASLAIKILSIFGGFLAILTFLGFLVLLGLYESKIGLILFGTGFILFAILLNKSSEKIAQDTMSVFMYASGLILLNIGLTMMNVSETFICFIVIFISSLCLFITQNFILSFIAIIAISTSFLACIMINKVYDLIHVYITVYTLLTTYFFLNETKIIHGNIKLSKLYNPIKIGLIFSLLFGLISIGKRDLTPIPYNQVWLSSIIMVITLLYLVKTILKISKVDNKTHQTISYALSFLIIIPTLLAPAIAGAIIIILLCFLINYKTGFIIGILSLFYFISQYYYDLSFSLLTKSMVLFGSGIVWLILYVYISKKVIK